MCVIRVRRTTLKFIKQYRCFARTYEAFKINHMLIHKTGLSKSQRIGIKQNSYLATTDMI